MTFLRNPAEIRHCLVKGLEDSKSLDAAVAFIGRDWADLIGTFSGQVRVVCWLSSSNTNPYAVEQMMGRKKISVLQLRDMHAKVYILKGDLDRCIVGSANLTSAALSEENASGQYEAAICVADKDRVRAIRRWFKALWQEAEQILPSDLEAAKIRWEEARSNRRKSANSNAAQDYVSPFPESWEPSAELLELAAEIRAEDFSWLDRYKDVLSRVVDKGERNDVEDLIRCVVGWTGREFAFRPALNEPSRRIRKAFKVLFDHARSIESRLQDLHKRGSCKLPGFALASLTMILHWRYPAEYPPYNRRTVRFLQDFGLDHYVPISLSPVQYGKWIAFAQELSARLDLPTTGHVDRLVWKHTADLELE